MASKERKPDLRDGMWSKPPSASVFKTSPGQIQDMNSKDPHVLKPTLMPQADGQATHQ